MNDSKELGYDVDVAVKTQFIQNQSDPDSRRFVFAYTITITNSGEVPAKLLTRHWIITDGDGDPSNGPEPTIVVVGDAQQLSIVKQVSVVGGGAADRFERVAGLDKGCRIFIETEADGERIVSKCSQQPAQSIALAKVLVDDEGVG